MIILNLLPKEEKIIFKQERNYIIIKNSLLLLMIAVILITIVLLGARLTLEKKFNTLVSDTSLPTNLISEVKRKITTINNKLQKINEIQKDYFNFSNPLIHLSELLPPNTYISLLDLNKDTFLFSIKGKAKNRGDLLNFQKNLEKSTLFKDIKYPLTNLLYKEDINFEFYGGLVPNNKNSSNEKLEK